MSGPKQIVRQRDFTGGEVVEHAKRRDDEAVIRASARTLRNVMILASGAVEQRPGRSALFHGEGRTDQVRVAPETVFYLVFGENSLTIRSSAGTVVATQAGYDWTEATAKNVRWTLFGTDVVMCFPGQKPTMARWGGGTTWTFMDWDATETSAGRKLVPFVRFASPGITMALSALTGSVTVTFSDDVLTAGHVGTRMRYYDKQITITAVTNGTTGTADVEEVMREIRSFDFTADVTAQFSVGDVLEGVTSSARMYVAEVGTPNDDDLTGIKLSSEAFSAGEDVIGPTGQAEFSSSSTVSTGPAITVWDEELFNANRGWPQFVTNDQNRLIFCDFPGQPEAIAWSASGDHFDFASGTADDAEPTDAIVEFAPKKSRVYSLTEGADEFIFTDRGIYYIPISESNPLRPGSIAFRRIPGAAAAAVAPVSTAQGVVYVNAGLNRVLAIVGTGQTAQPYIIRPASDLHSHLFSGITCIEVYEGDGDPPDEMVFAVNGDGTVVVGRFQPGKEWVGWVIWSGTGDVSWVSALGVSVVFTVDYAAQTLAEILDSTRYVDAAVDYDAIPAALVAPGVGPLWFLANETLQVMDGLRNIGTRAIDGDGDVVLQEGDAFTDETFGCVFGNVIAEPFTPHIGPGQSHGQTINRRQVSAGAVAVQNSTGFQVETWNPNDETWDVCKDRGPYDVGDDEGADPPLREEVVQFSKLGADYDPRIRIVKDYPGPVRVLEIDIEIGA